MTIALRVVVQSFDQVDWSIWPRTILSQKWGRWTGYTCVLTASRGDWVHGEELAYSISEGSRNGEVVLSIDDGGTNAYDAKAVVAGGGGGGSHTFEECAPGGASFTKAWLLCESASDLGECRSVAIT
jgi:hypothetical protein